MIVSSTQSAKGNNFPEIGVSFEGWLARGDGGTDSTGDLGNFTCVISARRRNCLLRGCLYREGGGGRLLRWGPSRRTKLQPEDYIFCPG